MPGWLRKFLNLDDEMPGYGPSSGGNYSAQSDYTPPARPSVAYTPPSQGSYTPPQPAPRYTPSYPAASSSDEATRRFAPSYSTPPAPASSAPRGVTAAPPPAAPRTLGPTGTVQPDGTVSPGGNVPSFDGQGYVQPLGYGLRSYARGALPPQGLEQFTREFRATLTDVWNFYSYWTRFQTDEVMRIGREALDAVVDNLPSDENGGSGSTVRRIKVTVGNGEKKVDRVATTTTVDPPPEPTPAAPPAPPAPTARFSATVTADDAAIPPAGRDTAEDFAARMTANAAEVNQDVAAEVAPIAADVSADLAQAAATLESDAQAAAASAEAAVKDVAEQAKDTAEQAKDAADDTKSAG
jgi:hypothetical protein